MKIASLAAALTIALSLPSVAQEKWPNRPVTLVVSQAAGASPDVMARMLAEKLGKELGESVIVENKPGGGNVIGAQAVARAKPDGYTFFFATSAALVTNPFMMKDLPYNPLKDYAPVALVTRSNQLIVTTPNVQAKNLSELIALDKKAPGKMSIAVDGPRNLAGVTALAFNKTAGTSFVLVPYPNINNGVQDVINGRAEVGVFSVSIVESQVRAGTLKAMAIAAPKRIAALPDVPAAGETIPGFDFAGWFMVVAPAGTPAEIINRLNAAVDRAVKDPAIKEMAPKLGFDIDPAGLGTPQAAATFLKAQTDMWAKTTKDLGIEPQ